MVIEIGNNKYNVTIAETNEEKRKGLQGKDSLKEDEGMLFIFDPPQRVDFWMKDVSFPLDIIFINEDGEVVKVAQGEPNDDSLISCNDVAFVLEVNTGSGIKKGDDISLEDEEDSGPVMKVLASDGSTQYELWGGERIFSRKNTKVLIRKAKKADASKEDKDYKALGKYMFKCLNIQDNRDPEYVQVKN